MERTHVAPAGLGRLVGALWVMFAVLMANGACSWTLTGDGLTGGVSDAGTDAVNDSPTDVSSDGAETGDVETGPGPDVHEGGDTSTDVDADGPPPCSASQVDCDGVDANGCEVNLDADPVNCGACGHDCLMGTCVSGRCQPVELASGQGLPSFVVVDATHVYWTNQGLDGGVMRIEKGGGTAELVAVTDHPPGGLAVDAQTVFWSELDGPGSVWRLDKDDIGTAVGPTALAVGQNTSIALTLDGDDVYWTTPGSVRTAPKTGGDFVVLDNDQDVPFSLLAEYNYVYWTNAVGGQIMRYHKAMPDAGAVELVSGQNTPAVLTSDLSSLFWTNNGNGEIVSMPRLGPYTPTVLATGQSGPTGIQQSGSYLYWSNNIGGTIMRMTKLGGVPEELAAEQAGPGGLAVDNEAVYWVNRDDGRVMKLAR